MRTLMQDMSNERQIQIVAVPYHPDISVSFKIGFRVSFAHTIDKSIVTRCTMTRSKPVAIQEYTPYFIVYIINTSSIQCVDSLSDMLIYFIWILHQTRCHEIITVVKSSGSRLDKVLAI